MRCKCCGYDLRGLREDRCPECGDAFDPANAKTYLLKPVSGRVPLVLAIIGLGLEAAPFLTLPLLPTFPGTQQPQMTILSLVGATSIVGTLILWSVFWRTYEAVWRKAPWVTQKNELIAAHLISVGVLGLTLAFAIVMLVKQ